MSKAQQCRKEASRAKRLAEEAKFAAIRLGCERSAATWRQLATYFKAIESPATFSRTDMPLCPVHFGVLRETKARRTDGKG